MKNDHIAFVAILSIIGWLVHTSLNATNHPIMVQQQQAAPPPPAPVQPKVIQVPISKYSWTEIDLNASEQFVGDVVESNVAVMERIENFGPPRFWMPTKESGLNRRFSLGNNVSLIQVRVSDDSPADTGTYQYTLKR